jgi:hypothetical protein
MKRNVGIFRTGAVVGMLALGVAAFGQNYGGGYGGGYGRARNGGGRNGRGLNADVLRQTLLGRVQSEVGFTDEEWSVVEPKLWKVVALQAQTGSGTLGQTVTRARGSGRGGLDVNSLIAQAVNNGNPLPVLQLQEELETLLDDPNTPLNLLEAKLQQYRLAMAQAKAQLEAAQADLQSVLTLRQEWELLEMGYLE